MLKLWLFFGLQSSYTHNYTLKSISQCWTIKLPLHNLAVPCFLACQARLRRSKRWQLPQIEMHWTFPKTNWAPTADKTNLELLVAIRGLRLGLGWFQLVAARSCRQRHWILFSIPTQLSTKQLGQQKTFECVSCFKRTQTKKRNEQFEISQTNANVRTSIELEKC